MKTFNRSVAIISFTTVDYVSVDDVPNITFQSLSRDYLLYHYRHLTLKAYTYTFQSLSRDYLLYHDLYGDGLPEAEDFQSLSRDYLLYHGGMFGKLVDVSLNFQSLSRDYLLYH